MASQNRQERQLMRQRGAGFVILQHGAVEMPLTVFRGRNVAGIDFGLNVGFGGSRQDRQQMRQRGAG